MSSYKLQSLFAIQKRCVRLLFGKEYSFDHAGYYETCARVRTYEENKSPKNYCLEHTKPLFNDHSLLNLHNLYVYQTFVGLFKVMKVRVPVSVCTMFNESVRDSNLRVCLPKLYLNISQYNYVFRSSTLWNSLIGEILEKSTPEETGIVIKGSTKKFGFKCPNTIC